MRSADSRVAQSPRASRSRDGFALPLAIMVLALLSMGLVAGFAMSTTEQSATASARAQVRAHNYAQMGLEAFLTRRKEFTSSTCVPATPYTATQAANCGFCPHCWAVNAAPTNGSVNANLDTLPTRPESVVVNFATGKAVVWAVPVWLDVPNGKGTYFVRSTGTDNQGGLTSVGTGNITKSTRTVSVYVTWNKSTMNVMGALVSFSGILKNGTGYISGVDECGGDTNVVGINVPSEESVVLNGSATTFQPTGNPPYDTLKTFSQDSAETKLDWAGITSGTTMPADVNITSTSSAFPVTGTFASDTNYWPIIHVFNRSTTGGWNSMWTLPNQGRGILIVDGDLTINGSNQWDGVVLVGGQLVSNGNNVTSGTVMAGLNRLIGISAGALSDADLNGTKSYQYNSCSVKKATSAMARYTMVPNTWMDNIAQY
jgi:hypothetical protein